MAKPMAVGSRKSLLRRWLMRPQQISACMAGRVGDLLRRTVAGEGVSVAAESETDGTRSAGTVVPMWGTGGIESTTVGIGVGNGKACPLTDVGGEDRPGLCPP